MCLLHSAASVCSDVWCWASNSAQSTFRVCEVCRDSSEQVGSEEQCISTQRPDYRSDTLSITYPIPGKLQKGHLRAFYGIQCTWPRLVTQHVEGKKGYAFLRIACYRGNEKWTKSLFASAIYAAME